MCIILDIRFAQSSQQRVLSFSTCRRNQYKTQQPWRTLLWKNRTLPTLAPTKTKAAREAAAKCEVNWDGAGKKEGIQIWRVENKRDANDNPIFGISRWPEKYYGEFNNGDSYIVLKTAKKDDALVWDVYFWIGQHSSQDEYGVAAYKANELDDLLGDAPVQHREVQGNESAEFMELFPKIRYLDGGIESGFRKVVADDESVKVPTRLYQIQRHNKLTRAFQVPLKASSMNQGDAFLLDAGDIIYTWFGQECSPFEKERTAATAHNMADARNGHCEVKVDVGDDCEPFWELLGGKDGIQPASVGNDAPAPVDTSTKMYVLSDEGGAIAIKAVETSKENLISGDVCIIDAGAKAFVWIGKGSSKREQEQSMLVVNKYLKINHRSKTTSVTRVLEGQEARSQGFNEVF